MKLDLVLLDGSDRRVTLADGGEVTVGTSAAATLRLNSVDVSRTHALITNQHGRVTVLDLGSTNGTFVNGRRIEAAELSAGDVVRFSSVVAQVLPVPARSAAAAGKPSTARQKPPSAETSEQVPVSLTEGLNRLLARWGRPEDGAVIALVAWLVDQRAMEGAAVVEEHDGELVIDAAHGALSGVLDVDGCGRISRQVASGSQTLEQVQIEVGGHKVLAVKGRGLPCLLMLPGSEMPESGEIELYARLLAVAQRIDGPSSAARGATR